MLTTRLGAALAIAVGMTGCAGSLKTFDQDQKEIAGVPFRAAEVYVKQGMRNKHSKGGKCDPTPFVETVSLATGSRFYATAKSSAFAKTAFHMKFTDAGALAEIGLDSEPAVADTITAATGLLSAVLPLIGAGAAVTALAADVVPTGPACDVGEDSVTFRKLEDYVVAQPKR